MFRGSAPGSVLLKVHSGPQTRGLCQLLSIEMDVLSQKFSDFPVEITRRTDSSASASHLCIHLSQILQVSLFSVPIGPNPGPNN